MKFHLSKYLILIALISFTTACNIDSPLSNHNTAANIKSETKWKISVKDEARLYKIFIKEYTREGKVNNIIEFLLSGDIKSLTQFNYNKEISYEETKFFNGDNSIDSVHKNIYVHNPSGKISKKISLSQGGDTSLIIDYSYDLKGNLIRKIQTDLETNKSVITNIQYFYNNDGNVVGRLVNPNINGTYESRDSIAYQSEGIKIELYNYNRDGNINLIFTYFYNKYGFIHREYQSTIDGKIKDKFEYEYTYWN